MTTLCALGVELVDHLAGVRGNAALRSCKVLAAALLPLLGPASHRRRCRGGLGRRRSCGLGGGSGLGGGRRGCAVVLVGTFRVEGGFQGLLTVVVVVATSAAHGARSGNDVVGYGRVVDADLDTGVGSLANKVSIPVLRCGVTLRSANICITYRVCAREADG